MVIKEYNPDRLIELLVQFDNLLHNRVNMFLLTQTVFFAAAAASWQNPWLVRALAVGGILTAALFFTSTVKLYWRVIWLLESTASVCPELKGCLDVEGRDSMRFSWIDRKLQAFLLAKEGRMPCRLKDTGFLFTWGLGAASLAGWASMAVFSV